jgi:DNA repair exonuclease SbcCD nuclease subunit
MKIGVIGDTHLGNKRFYEESFLHLERALKVLEKENCDVVIQTGDLFDSKDVSLETLYKAFNIFKVFNKMRIFVISGNHDRRARSEVDAVKLLAHVGCYEYLHDNVVNINDFSFLAMSYVNDANAQEELKNLIEKNKSLMKEKKVLIIHQNIKDYSPGDGLESSYLKSLGFYLIIDGHIHKRIYDWPIILPGSLLATSLVEEEAEKRGVTVIDTEKKEARFLEIEQRPIIIETLHFHNATKEEILEKIKKLYHEYKQKEPNAIIKFVLRGSTKSTIIDFATLLSIKDLFLDIKMEKADLKDSIFLWQEKFNEAKKQDDEKMLIETLKSKVEKPEEKLELLYEYDSQEIVNYFINKLKENA